MLPEQARAAAHPEEKIPHENLSDQDFGFLQDAIFANPKDAKKLIDRLSPSDAGKLLTTPYAEGQYVASVLEDDLFRDVVAKAETRAVNTVLGTQVLSTMHCVSVLCHASDTQTIEKVLNQPSTTDDALFVAEVLTAKTVSEQDKLIIVNKVSSTVMDSWVKTPVNHEKSPLLWILIDLKLHRIAAAVTAIVSPGVLYKVLWDTHKGNTTFLHLFSQKITRERFAVIRQIIERSQISDVDLANLSLVQNRAGRSTMMQAIGLSIACAAEDVREELKEFIKGIVFTFNAVQMQRFVLSTTIDKVNVLHLPMPAEWLERILILAGQRAFLQALSLIEVETTRDYNSPLSSVLSRQDEATTATALFYLSQMNTPMIDKLLKHHGASLIGKICHKKDPQLLRQFVRMASAKEFFQAIAANVSLLYRDNFLVLLDSYPVECKAWLADKSPKDRFVKNALYHDNRFSTLIDIAAFTPTFQYKTAWLVIFNEQLNWALENDKLAADKVLELKYAFHTFHGDLVSAMGAIEQMQDMKRLSTRILFEVVNHFRVQSLEMRENGLGIMDATYLCLVEKVKTLSLELTRRGVDSHEEYMRSDTATLCNTLLASHIDTEYKVEETKSVSSALLARYDELRQARPVDAQAIYKKHFDAMSAVLGRQKSQTGGLIQPDRATYAVQVQVYSELKLQTADPARLLTVQAAIQKLDDRNEFKKLLKNLEADMVHVLRVRLDAPVKTVESTTSCSH